MITWAEENWGAIQQQGHRGTQRFAIIDSIVGSLATAILAVANNPSPGIINDPHFHSIFTLVADLLELMNTDSLRYFGNHCVYNSRAIPSFVTPRALASISLGLSRLRDQGFLTGDILRNADAIVRAIFDLVTPIRNVYPLAAERAEALLAAHPMDARSQHQIICCTTGPTLSTSYSYTDV